MRSFAKVAAIVIGAVAFLAGATAFVASILPSDQVLFLPTPARPLAPVVTVEGERRDPSPDGPGLLYVAISERPASLLEAWTGGLQDGAELVPKKLLKVPGTSEAEQDTVDKADMTDSQRVAAAVAEKALGKPVKIVTKGVRIVYAAVSDGASPAHDAGLRSGDVIVKIDDGAVATLTALRTALRKHRPGEVVRIGYVRNGSVTPALASVTTRADPDDPERAILGIDAQDEVDITLPVNVTYRIGDVEGPSAGLAFALQIYAALSGKSIVGGHRVAVTGSIAIDGTVGPIGGVRQKAFGAVDANADVFLVPAENLDEARTAAPTGLRVLAVRTFAEALRTLAGLPAK